MCDTNGSFSARDEEFMRGALEQAQLARHEGEVPVGCVIVKDNQIVGSGRNATNERKNGTRHAEMVAIDGMLQDTNGDVAAADFPNCILYVTCEPCIMCAGALSLLGFKSVLYGCCNDKFGGNGSIVSVHEDGCGRCCAGGGTAPSYSSQGGLFAKDAIELLQDFYISGNPNAPKPHRPVRGQS